MQLQFIFLLKTRSRIVISAALAAALILCCGCAGKEAPVFKEADSRAGTSATAEAAEKEESPSAVIGVFVCGAVVREGVYELPEGARVIDAVNAAGGYRDDADRTYVNQAAYVSDTERIEIPTTEEAALLREADREARGADGRTGRAESPAESSGLININTAGAEELMTLPGIGESKASEIIRYRESHGPFGAVEEIMNVSGIGNSVYEKLKDCISVE